VASESRVLGQELARERVAAVESRVVVDVDPGYIAHEALRTLAVVPGP
jgi:hypothetical protein